MRKDEFKRLFNKIDALQRNQKDFEFIMHRRLETITDNLQTVVNGLNQILPDQITIRKEMPTDLLNYLEAAELLKIPIATIQHLSKNGKIPFIKTTSGRKYSEAELKIWITARPTNTASRIRIIEPIILPERTTIPTDLLNAYEAGKILGVGERTVRKWAVDGKIPYVLAGRGKRYSRAELEMIVTKLQAS